MQKIRVLVLEPTKPAYLKSLDPSEFTEFERSNLLEYVETIDILANGCEIVMGVRDMLQCNEKGQVLLFTSDGTPLGVEDDSEEDYQFDLDDDDEDENDLADQDDSEDQFVADSGLVVLEAEMLESLSSTTVRIMPTGTLFHLVYGVAYVGMINKQGTRIDLTASMIVKYERLANSMLYVTSSKREVS